jgi:hypothetical protein
MTKTQEKNEKSIASLEKSFDVIMEALRALNNEGKFKKKHTLIVEEVKYLINNIDNRVSDKRSGPLKW